MTENPIDPEIQRVQTFAERQAIKRRIDEVVEIGKPILAESNFDKTRS